MNFYKKPTLIIVETLLVAEAWMLSQGRYLQTEQYNWIIPHHPYRKRIFAGWIGFFCSKIDNIFNGCPNLNPTTTPNNKSMKQWSHKNLKKNCSAELTTLKDNMPVSKIF